MEISKLVLPVSILLGCVILGGFYYASAVAQQAAAEKQQQAILQAQQQTMTASSTESANANTQNAITQAQSDYDICLNQAQQTYKASIQAACGGASGCSMSIAQAQEENNVLANDKALCEQHYQATLQVVNK